MSSKFLPLSGSRVGAGLVFVSGQLALRDGSIIDADVAKQTELVLDALTYELKRHALTLADVVKTGVWLTAAENFAAFNDVYARRFSNPYPARSTVISGLAIPGALVEIDAIAVARL